jgi:hypothetical protein
MAVPLAITHSSSAARLAAEIGCSGDDISNSWRSDGAAVWDTSSRKPLGDPLDAPADPSYIVCRRVPPYAGEGQVTTGVCPTQADGQEGGGTFPAGTMALGHSATASKPCGVSGGADGLKGLGG